MDSRQEHAGMTICFSLNIHSISYRTGQIDLSSLNEKGVFKAWNNYEKFKSVYIDKETKSIAWDRNIELDTNNLYLQLIENRLNNRRAKS